MPRPWDEVYQQPENVKLDAAPLLVEIADQLAPGRALDLACGVGRHALYLARLGWNAVAVDSSRTAIDLLRKQCAAETLRVDARLADLETGEFTIEPAAYDLICDFFYLQRGLFQAIRKGVRPGGIFVAEIHLRDDNAIAGPRNPAFVLEPGELRRTFADWKIVFYSEGLQPGKPRATARIIARRA